MLLAECDQVGVKIKTHCDIKKIKVLDLKGHSDKYQHEDRRSRYQLSLHQDHAEFSVQCQSLVVATGALSIPSLGGSGIGYEIANQFNIPVTKRQAGLVPFMFSDRIKTICEQLSGLSLEVTVHCNGQALTYYLISMPHIGLLKPRANIVKAN